MDDGDVNNLSKVNYVTDKKSKFELEKFLFMNANLKIFSFGIVLAKLGFETDKTLYLKRKNKLNSLGLEFYYSYDKDNFNEDNIIRVGCRFSTSIDLICNGRKKEYFIRKKYNNEVYLKNEFYEREIKYGGVTYYCRLYNGELKILINDENDLEFDFVFDGVDEEKFILEFENNYELQQDIFSIKLTDSFDEIICKLSKVCEIDKSYNKDVSLTYLKDGILESGYWMKKYGSNNNIRVKVKNELGEVTYELYRSVECDDYIGKNKYLIKLQNDLDRLEFEFVNRDSSFEIENELELRSYLLGLRYPIKVDEVFKKVCEISLGDVCKYDRMDLSIYNGCLLTDNIVLKKGILDIFKTTRDGKVFKVSKNGDFSYEVEDEISSYSIDMMGDIVTRCEQYCQNGIYNGDDANWTVYNVIRDAKEAKVRTRKIIDEMLKNERR